MSDEKQYIPNPIDDLITEELLKNRKIFMFGDIDNDMASKTIKQLIYLANTDEPIVIMVFSDGGDVEAVSAILDTMNLVKTRCTLKTVCYKACSAAADVVAMGTKGSRYIFPTALMMLHKTSIELPMDDEDKQRQFIEFMKTQGKLINQMVAKACGKTSDKFVKDIAQDLWLGAVDAKKYKIVDHIVKDLTEI